MCRMSLSNDAYVAENIDCMNSSKYPMLEDGHCQKRKHFIAIFVILQGLSNRKYVS